MSAVATPVPALAPADRGARSVVGKVMGYELRDVLRSRWLVGYTAFYWLAADALLRFAGDGATALLSLVNVVLLIIPLVTIVFGTMYLYHAREFVELLLAQPVSRRQLFTGLYLGLTLPLVGAFALGTTVPFVYHGALGATPGLGATLLTLVGAGALLTLVFSSLAFLIAVRAEDRVRGLGTAIALWLALAVVFDGLVLLLATLFADYPLERPLLGLMLANPVDLARVVLLLRLDVSALMGYTGAVFRQFFGSVGGLVIASLALAAWAVAPFAAALRAFERKDF